MKIDKIGVDLLADADLCVKCGLCLPYCPTYVKTQDENESPRGRIELIRAWAGKNLPASDALSAHIDHCLLCRSCERVCPAKVPYGKLVDTFRSQQRGSSGFSLALRLLKVIAHHRQVSRFAKAAISFYQTSGLQKTGLCRRLGLASIDRLLPEKQSRDNLSQHRSFFPAVGNVRGEVGLFVGCMGQLLENETVAAAIRVLNHCGFSVHLPLQQSCCGALDLHNGDQKTAEKLAAQNSTAFSADSLAAIVTIASGCGAVLKEYQQRSMGDRVVDISCFLYQHDATAGLNFSPFSGNICIHSPCSLQNVMQEHRQVIKLIEQITGIEVCQLPDTITCCGSAGSYMLQYPVMAKAILTDLLRAVDKLKPDFLLTSNIGCALHIKAGLKQENSKTEVLHPIVLISRLLSP